MYYKHYKPNIQRRPLLSLISGVLLYFCDVISNKVMHVALLTDWWWGPFFRYLAASWRFCPTGYYLNGFRAFETIQCCRPVNHPKSYGPCYYEDDMRNSGQRRCQLPGYYITGYYRQKCFKGYFYSICVRKLRCCKMTNTGNSILLDSHFDQESAVK